MPKIYDENGIATEIDDSIYYSLEDLPCEEWKDIIYFDKKRNQWVDFRGKYQISNKGRVKSLTRFDRCGKPHYERILKSDTLVYLSNENYSSRHVTIEPKTLIRYLFSIMLCNPRKQGNTTICLTTGIIYCSAEQASRQTLIDVSSIRECCKRNPLYKYAGRLVGGKIVTGCEYRNKGIPLIWRYMEDVVYEG